MATQAMAWVSPEDYLRQERAAETKSEYIDGMIVAMSGASLRHARITTNVVGSLHGQLANSPCQAFTQDLRVHIAEGGMYAYPDVVVVCGQPELEDDQFDVLLNPTLIVEVLSESTEAYDRGPKFARYRMRASLKDYVLVAQDRVSVERYSRNGEHWMLTEAKTLDAVIELPSIGCTLALRDVYDKVEGVPGIGAPLG